MRQVFQLLSLVAFLTLTTTGIGQPGKGQTKRPTTGQGIGKWSMIGQKSVKRVSEYDDFTPPGSGIYSALKLKILNSRVQFDRIVIEFETGRNMDIPLNVVIPENGESRIIDLPGERRKIRRIRFKYNTKGLFNDRAIVQVWGRK